MNTWALVVIIGFAIFLLPVVVTCLFCAGNYIIVGAFGVSTKQSTALEAFAVGCAILGLGAILAGSIGIMTTMRWGMQ